MYKCDECKKDINECEAWYDLKTRFYVYDNGLRETNNHYCSFLCLHKNQTRAYLSALGKHKLEMLVFELGRDCEYE